jgi:cbb3-type cytochrome oxidase subunit 3
VRSYATPSRSDKAGVAIRSVISSRTGRLGGCVLGFRGNGPALAGKLGGGSAFALRAMARVIASNARSGPFPLPPRADDVDWPKGSVAPITTIGAVADSFRYLPVFDDFWGCGGWVAVVGLRGSGPALAGKLGGGSAFALRAMARVIASNARSGPFPLPPRAGSVSHNYTKGATLYYSDTIVIGPETGCPEAIR